MTARLTPEERARLREACEGARRFEFGATARLAGLFSIDTMLALLDERDALAAEVDRLRQVVIDTRHVYGGVPKDAA